MSVQCSTHCVCKQNRKLNYNILNKYFQQLIHYIILEYKSSQNNWNKRFHQMIFHWKNEQNRWKFWKHTKTNFRRIKKLTKTISKYKKKNLYTMNGTCKSCNAESLQKVHLPSTHDLFQNKENPKIPQSCWHLLQ